MRVLFTILALVGVLVLATGITVISTYNQAVSLESSIVATADNNEQVLNQFYNRLEETVAVTDIYATDFRDSMTAMLAGRYGSGGSQADFQWIQEAMPNLDASMYQSVQDLIRSDRTRFEQEQRRLIDQRRQYERLLRAFPSGIILGAFDFPKMDLDDQRFKPVSGEEARTARETGNEEARDIRGLRRGN
jgi:hypothetical protein